MVCLAWKSHYVRFGAGTLSKFDTREATHLPFRFSPRFDATTFRFSQRARGVLIFVFLDRISLGEQRNATRANAPCTGNGAGLFESIFTGVFGGRGKENAREREGDKNKLKELGVGKGSTIVTRTESAEFVFSFRGETREGTKGRAGRRIRLPE